MYKVPAVQPYRIKRVVESKWLTGTSTFNLDFAKEDLAASKLTIEDIAGYAPDNMILPTGATAGYVIPYWNLKGDVIRDASNFCPMYRIKLQYPPFSKAIKYTQPTREELSADGLPGFLPYLIPCAPSADPVIYCCEGEKKTASFIKHFQLPAFGISGCTTWGNPAGTGGVHPWITDYLNSRGIKKVIIIPDGDIFKYDICTSYGTYAHALIQAGFEVEILNLKDKIDDLIVRDNNFTYEQLERVPRLAPHDLNQSPASLAVKYDLAFKRDKFEKVIPHQHTSNIMRLMEAHPAFPKVWRNNDTNRVHLGDEEAQPDLTEMNIANHFQHNFGMDKVTSRVVYQCIQALAKRNQRSPMLEYVRGQIWDGVPRLATWLTDCWGIEDTPFVREIATKWLVSSCARMDRPGTKVDWMFIVIGPQGTGKTSMPNVLFRGNYLSLYGDNNDKDLHMLLHSALVVGFDELDSFSRKDTSLLKAMITRTEDFFRPPYGASVEVFKRRFTLYGCGNKHQFLQADPSGQRRYAIVECTRLLDFKMLEAMTGQLWAEAWQIYNTQQLDWWEVKHATEEAEKYEIPNITEEKMLIAIDRERAAKQAPNNGQPFKFQLTQLLEWMNISYRAGDPMHRELAALLHKHKWERKVIKVDGEPRRFYSKKD